MIYYSVYFKDDFCQFPFDTIIDGHLAPAEFDTFEEAIGFCKKEVRDCEGAFRLLVYETDNDGNQKHLVYETP